MVAGVGTGMMLGWSVSLLGRLALAIVSPESHVYGPHWNATVAGYGLVASALIALIALAFALMGSVVVALASRHGTPIEELHHSAR
jgi:hypothetical protein